LPTFDSTEKIFDMLYSPLPRLKPLLYGAAIVALCVGLSACQSQRKSMGTHAPAKVASVETLTEAELQRAADYWGKQYERNNKDLGAALNYGTALRSLNRTEQSVAVLRRAVIAHPKSTEAPVCLCQGAGGQMVI
jgi:Flp pilus assembly protein TadD